MPVSSFRGRLVFGLLIRQAELSVVPSITWQHLLHMFGPEFNLHACLPLAILIDSDIGESLECCESHRTSNVSNMLIIDTPPMLQAELLEQLANSSSEDVEKYFQPRHVIDILIDFDECTLRLEELLPCLNPLHPRLYSISSSPLEHPGRVQASSWLPLELSTWFSWCLLIRSHDDSTSQ